MNTLKIFLAIIAGSAEIAAYANDFPESPQNRTSDQRPQNPPQRLQQNAELRSLNQPKNGRNKIAFDQLPQIVQRTIKLEAGGAEIGDLSRAELNGQAVYRAEFDRDGVHHELFISPAGNIAARVQETASAAPMENRHSLSLADTPKSVQQSVRKNARAGLVTGVEKGTLNGETAYNVMFDNHGRLSEYIFDQNGNVLAQTGRPISEAAGAPNVPNHSKQPDTEQHNHRILQHPK